METKRKRKRISSKPKKITEYPYPFYPHSEPTELQKAIFKWIIYDVRQEHFRISYENSRSGKSEEERGISLEVLRALEHVRIRDTIKFIAFEVKYSRYYEELFNSEIKNR